MNTRSIARMSVLLVGLIGVAGATQAQQPGVEGAGVAGALTTNMPARAGEASTMTNGVPNLLTSNVQPGELGIQTRLRVRPAASAYGGDPGLRMMGASGPM